MFYNWKGLECPAPDNRVCKRYFDQCANDAECKYNEKCCLQPGCGYSCKVAV